MQAEDFPNGTQEEHLRRELAEAKTSTAVAQKTIAENETARMKVELEKRTSEVQMMTERWNSFASSRSDSTTSSVGAERSNSLGSARSDSITSMRQISNGSAVSRSNSTRHSFDSGIVSRSSSDAGSSITSRSNSSASRQTSQVSRSDSISENGVASHCSTPGDFANRDSSRSAVSDSGMVVGTPSNCCNGSAKRGEKKV